MKSASAVLAPAEKTGKFLEKEKTHMCQEAEVLETASQAHHTTAAIQKACRRRNTGTSYSRGTLRI